MTIHYVCVATESKLYFPYLKQLVPDLVVLGMNKKWKGFIMKYELLIKYLKTLNDNDIVCFIDAYDVLPTKNITHLEKQFVKFSNKHPKIKMIVGGGVIKGKIQKICNDIIFDNSIINSGTYIGYAKNILHVLLEIMKQPKINDDQIELIKYTKNNPNDIFIDIDNNFFLTKSTPLQQVNLEDNIECSFIHANGNGLLEDFLLEHHNIHTDVIIRSSNFIKHCISIKKKINIYIKTASRRLFQKKKNNES
jgi:hypothetical protein